VSHILGPVDPAEHIHLCPPYLYSLFVLVFAAQGTHAP